MTSAHDSGERYPLGEGFAIIGRVGDYLRVEEHGNPTSPEDTERYFAAIERALVTAGVTGLVIVAQATGANPSSSHWRAIREARWRALANTRAERVAVIVDDELGVTRVQMTAVAMRAPVRAFVREQDALAWVQSRS